MLQQLTKSSKLKPMFSQLAPRVARAAPTGIHRLVLPAHLVKARVSDHGEKGAYPSHCYNI